MKKFLILSLLVVSTVGFAQEQAADATVNTVFTKEEKIELNSNIAAVENKNSTDTAKVTDTKKKNFVSEKVEKAVNYLRTVKAADVKACLKTKEFAIFSVATAAVVTAVIAVKKCTWIQKKLGLTPKKKLHTEEFLV
ncbi:MAG: hypothetical protein WCE21_00700 [Candidatus Babeliales bacterium]